MIGSHTATTEAYLTQFAEIQQTSDRKPKVWTYQRGKRPFAATPERIGKENGYFALTNPDGTKDESLEWVLADLERRGAQLLPLLNYETYVMSSRDIETIKGFIALMFARTTARRDLSAQLLAHIRSAYQELAEDPEWVQHQAEGYERFSGALVSTGEISAATSKVLTKLAKREHINNSFVQGLLRIAEDIFQHLSPMRLQIWRAADSTAFITTDNPIITFAVLAGKVSIGCGLRTPGVFVAFPLSPRCCVLIGSGIGQARAHWHNATTRETRDINLALAQCMNRWAYSNLKSQETEQLINSVGGTLRYGVNIFVPSWMSNAKEDIKAKVKAAVLPRAAVRPALNVEAI